jgi:ABC-type branched-subunit amino acid transport system ATPase component/ABC-type branched-subunit amino acid transport system permease subunit
MTARGIIAAVLALALLGVAIAKADGYQIFIIAMVGLTAIVGIGLNVLLGLTGQISFGHVAFYAIGAYALGILTTKGGLSFWLALPAAMVVSGIAGLALVVPALRIRGPYLAMVTIAFGFVVEQGAVEWSGLTGGWNGLQGIAAPTVFGYAFSERDIVVLIVVLTILSLWLYARLAASPWGLGMRALRDSEVASQSIGLDPVLIRSAAFVISAVAAGMAGAIFASISSFISPESFPFFQSILFVLVVMAGGAERMLGPVVGAIIVVMVPELLSSLAQYRLLFVGLLLLIVLRAAPGGFVGLVARFFEKKPSGRTAAGPRDVASYLGQSTQRSGLLVSNLSISFGGVHAVRNVGFEARPGEITSIIGPNGAGKSTVLNLICGFYRADTGVVRLGIQDLMGRSSSAIAQAGLARTYQTTQLFGEMSVIDNIIVALRRGHLGATTLFTPERNAENEAVAESLLAFVGYRGPLETLASALPHVDKRLVEVARALAIRPAVLLLDEPAAGLDDTDTEQLGRLLTEVARIGIVVILVEHDMQLVMGVSDRVVVLDAGAKIADGTPAEVAADPAVLKAYLGAEKSVDRSRTTALGPGETVLSVMKLGAGYGAVNVLHNVDLSVEQGGFVAVLGANGAGKSTLMRALSGLSRPVSGEIRLDADAIETLPANKIAARGLILVPEGRQVFPELSVVDNLRLGAYARASGDVEQQVQTFLDRFPNLEARRNQRAGLLSGGEQQMLAIARGLMANPRVLMLDEPSLGLAPKLVEEMYDLLAGLRDEGVTILLVDQTAVMALSVADRAYVLQSGAIVHSGSARELSADPAVAQAYLGAAAPPGKVESGFSVQRRDQAMKLI